MTSADRSILQLMGTIIPLRTKFRIFKIACTNQMFITRILNRKTIIEPKLIYLSDHVMYKNGFEN